MKHIALIVPAYHPTQDMIPMLERFSASEDYQPVVVNDGSGKAYDHIFAQVPEGCILLNHEVNKGKGMALKTAIRYILDYLPDCDFAVTADADGQHLDKDIAMVTESAMRTPGTLVTGARQFEGDVPFRSRFGNGVTRAVFSLASGVRLQDTQTGLRAFDRSQMAKLAEMPGERYEYEINMLLYASRDKIPIREETIKTVYIDDNSASSFNVLRDSAKIYKCIFRFMAASIIGFAFSSLLAFGIDFVMLLLLKWLTKGMTEAISLLISVVGARIVSATVNFIVNKKVVFKSGSDWKKEFVGYVVLAACILAVNYLLMNLLTIQLRWPLVLSKLLVEVVLFCASYIVQRKFIYKGKKA